MARNEREYCQLCDCATGKAGKGDDSLYLGGIGPLCPDCHAIISPELTAVRAELAALRIVIIKEYCGSFGVLLDFLDVSKTAEHPLGGTRISGGRYWFPARAAAEAALDAAVKAKMKEGAG